MRLFVAVRPSAEASAHLARALGREPDPRWHVTLAFLGERPSADPYDLSLVAASHTSFPLALSGAMRLGDVAAVGVRGDVGALTSLARDVQHTCDVQEHRRYRPHLTVGRRVVPESLWDYEGPAFRVESVELVQSVLGRSAVHTVLEQWRLG